MDLAEVFKFNEIIKGVHKYAKPPIFAYLYHLSAPTHVKVVVKLEKQ